MATPTELRDLKRWLGVQGYGMDLVERRGRRVQWYKPDGKPVPNLLSADADSILRYLRKGWTLKPPNAPFGPLEQGGDAKPRTGLPEQTGALPPLQDDATRDQDVTVTMESPVKVVRSTKAASARADERPVRPRRMLSQDPSVPKGHSAQDPQHKKRKPYDVPDLSALPPGQHRAIEALVGDGVDRTYPEAAKAAGMAEGTLLTHINRVRRNHPELYAAIRDVRKAQLAVRHEIALASAREHSRIYWRRVNRQLRQLVGFSPW